MTGHLIFTTMHTIDSASAFNRLADLGIDPSRIATAVNLIIAQRLARTICTDCRNTYVPKSSDMELVGLSAGDGLTFIHGTGCNTCMKTGYYGRLGIFEMLRMSERLRRHLEDGSPTTVLREVARKEGTSSLREEGLRMVRDNMTTIEEVLRVTSH